MNRSKLGPTLIVATVLGIGLLVLQRWVAETRDAAIILVVAWFAFVAVVALIATRSRPELRAPMLGTIAAIALATVAIGYWTGFRDKEVDEDVVVAAPASIEQADEGGEPGEKRPDPGPVQVAAGEFAGADGHAGTGVATVVAESGGNRFLTFTEFDVDPGAQVEVWLTRDPDQVDDRIELGGLKGNVGDQQYELPADVEIGTYDTVVLYCTPFTVRIAVADLDG